MPVLRLDTFSGIKPGIHPQKLELHDATVARNVRLFSQALEPRRAPNQVRGTGLTPRAMLYTHYGRWLDWSQRVDAVHSIIGNDPFDRVFWTGQGAPRVADSGRAISGGGPYPGASLRLGVPPPETPAARVVGSPQDPDETAQSRSYVVTLVNQWGEEGPPCAATAVVSVRPGETVELDLLAPPGGAYDFAYYRVYRFAQGIFQFVGQTSPSMHSFADNLPAELAQEELPSLEWDPPPEDLRGLTAVAGSFLAGFRKNELLVSEFGLPHAWPVRYRTPVDYPIVGLGSFGNTLVICTEGALYLAQGGAPAAMTPVDTGLYQACLAAESIVAHAGGVLYAAPDGLVLVDQNGARVITEGVITAQEWRQFHPGSLRATQWNGLYLAFWRAGAQSGALLFNPRAPQAGFVTFDADYPDALYHHAASDTVYLAYGDDVYQWDAGAPMSYRWRSRPLDLANPYVMQCARVLADGYPVTLRLYADDTLQCTVSIADDRPVRLPAPRRARSYMAEIEADRRVYQVVATSNMGEMRRI